MRTIPPKGSDKHECYLDSAREYEDDTLAQCSECGKWYYKRTTYQYWVEHSWNPVRWYHFSKLERIRNYMEEKIILP